jgi:protein FAM32A
MITKQEKGKRTKTSSRFRRTTRQKLKRMGFENVVGGKLKLKGAAIEKPDKKKKKKKKKKTKDKKREYVELNETDEEEDDGLETKTKELDTRTEAEKAHEERSRQQRRKRIVEQAELSHKDKVKLFNEKLAKLSEHHDIPKVGPG